MPAREFCLRLRLTPLVGYSAPLAIVFSLCSVNNVFQCSILLGAGLYPELLLASLARRNMFLELIHFGLNDFTNSIRRLGASVFGFGM